MAGKSIRIEALISYIGLSRSAIYDRMDEKSPRYDPSFPKKFRLGGKAVAWYQSEVDAWLAACASNPNGDTSIQANSPVPSPKSSVTQPSLESIQGLAPASKRLTPPSAPTSRNRDLAATIVAGAAINTRLLDYVKMKAWTPAMGALLISGIEPPLECKGIPIDGIGLDGEILNGNHQRFADAKRILEDWRYWEEDTPQTEVEPHIFLDWCADEKFNSEWLRLFLDLIGHPDSDAPYLQAARLFTSKNI